MKFFLSPIIFLLFFIPKDILSQKALYSSIEPLSEIQTKKAGPGTFQIIYRDRTNAEPLNSDVLHKVEQQRHDKKVKYLIVNEFVKIKILPKSVIASKNFKRIDEYIISD